MAVAPLNKFLTIAVPVAPGEQTIYKAPVGTSAIVLYAQVANVGVNTYPTVTFTHRRTSVATRTAGNIRNNRIIKDGEIVDKTSYLYIKNYNNSFNYNMILYEWELPENDKYNNYVFRFSNIRRLILLQQYLLLLLYVLTLDLVSHLQLHKYFLY